MKLVIVFQDQFKIHYDDLVELAITLNDFECVKEVSIYDS